MAMFANTKSPEQFCQLPGVDKEVRKSMISYNIATCPYCGHKYDLLKVKYVDGNPRCPACRN